jgi:hypothetical protein
MIASFSNNLKPTVGEPCRIAACIALVLTPAIAGEFHVKPGDSLAASVSAARAKPGPHTITLAPGRYFLTKPLVLDDRDSGLTLRGAGTGAVAEIYGGQPVTGWEKWKDGIWRAPVPKDRPFYNLIVDGRPAVMAQTPNAGSGFGGGAQKLSNTALRVPAEWRGYDFSDAQVSAFIGGNWFSEMRAPTGFDPATSTLSVDPGQGAQFGGMNARFFVRGVLELLDEPGEWCLKQKEGFVYYWPESGTPADHLIVRPVGERVLEVHGRSSQTPAKNIVVENVSLIGSDFSRRWHLFAPGQDGSTPEPFQQGLVFGENVTGLKITACRILAAGHSGLWLNRHARDCVVESCLVSGAGFAGIYANGYMPDEGPFQSAAASYVNRGHRIENNLIHDCGKFIGGGCGIQLYQCGDTLVTRNRIRNMPRYGISYKGLRWGLFPKKLFGRELTFDSHFDHLHTRNLRITGNEISSVCRNSFDFGGIESWSPGRDNLWANNALHDIDQTLDWNGWAHVLFADDASHWLTIRGNIIHHCHGGRLTGAFMMKSLNQGIENNLVADCDIGRVVTLEPYCEPGGNFTIRRNVFASDGAFSRYAPSKDTFTGLAGTLGKLPPGVGGIKEVDFNLIAPRDPASPNDLAAKGVDTHSIFADPKLVRAKPDWDLTFRDYALAADSPARKLGFMDIDVSAIGLRADFPFDEAAATRREATAKLQAEDYQRMHGLRTSAGTGIYLTNTGTWAKYENLDFGDGVSKAVFQLDATSVGNSARTPFVRRYGDTVAEAKPFKADASVETVTRWEISKPYSRSGSTGPQLFDEAFEPERDSKAGEWRPMLEPVQTRAGIRGEPGVVDFDAANGEGHANSCAYARASIHAVRGRTNATMTVSCASGVKVWLNGQLIIAENKPGTFSETKKGIINQGWNTILVKVNQDAAKWSPRTSGQGNFWFKFGTVASSCGEIVSLPGLPTDERAKAASAGSLIELRLGSPEGKLIGSLAPGSTECPVESTTGVQNLFLRFPGDRVRSVDWFKFEK